MKEANPGAKPDQAPEPKTVPFCQLFTVADRLDKLLIVLGTLAAMATGVCLPMSAIFLGEVNQSFDSKHSPDDMVESSRIACIKTVTLGAIALVLAAIMVSCWMIVGRRIGIKYRKAVLTSVLMNRDVTWFDLNHPQELPTKIASLCAKVQHAVGEKVAMLIFSLTMAISGLVIGFVYGWQLSLCLCGLFPLMGITTACLTKVISEGGGDAEKAYAKSGGLAEEALNAVRTVYAFCTQGKEVAKYAQSLGGAKEAEERIGFFMALALAIMNFTMDATFGLGYFIASYFVQYKVYNHYTGRAYRCEECIIVFFSIMFGSYSLGLTAPTMKAIAEGQVAGAELFELLNPVPTLPPKLALPAPTQADSKTAGPLPSAEKAGEPASSVQDAGIAAKKEEVETKDVPAAEPQAKGDAIQDAPPQVVVAGPPASVPEAVEKGANHGQAQATKPKKQLPPNQFCGRIEFRDVSFKYPSNPTTMTLNKLSFVVAANKTTAICGESGCGKSTTFQLLERFYDVTSGQILVDNEPIEELDIPWWRKQIGYVGQEPVLFNTTIKENIRYGNQDVTDKDIEEACQKANCYDFIMRLPKGLETLAGIEGSQLSGGEKQRIALARAMVRRPKILLLDEATSALDRANEAEVQQAIKSVSQGITTLVIAHRLSTIKDADQILVLRDGAIVEAGIHDDLLALGHVYAVMYAPTKEIDAAHTAIVSAPVAQAPEVKLEIRMESVGEPKTVEVAKEQQAETEMTFTQAFKRVWRENQEHIGLIWAATILSLLMGIHFPAVGALNGAMFYDLLLPDYDEMRDSINKELGYVLVVGFVAAVLMDIALVLFSKASVRVAQKTRSSLYSKILSMHMAWHDQPEHSPAKLCMTLHSEAAKLNSVLDTILGMALSSVMAALIAIGISFYFCWRMALIIVVLLPLMGVAGIIDAKITTGSEDTTDVAYKESLNILSESIRNIRTVLAFGGEQHVLGLYSKALELPLKSVWLGAIFSGLCYGLSQFVQFGIFSASFYFGAIFVRDYNVNAKDMFISFYTATITGYSIGQSMQYAASFGEAMAALKFIARILAETSAIQDLPNAKSHELKGKIEFRGVTFTYPTRKYPVLKDINFTIEPGQKVGIVGMSGSGKSTIIQLLERFYDIDKGQILLDDIPIQEIKLAELRQQLGLVAQEPVIFDLTIGENISYAMAQATDEQITAAATTANALDFIRSDEAGFKRRTGQKGGQLSGGEKQRVAIARAILKDPKLMLLDEATSALDHDSEEAVQQGLNAAMQHRTSLVIAHRLSTIADSNIIFLLERGRIIERGTHQELLALRGRYYQLQAGAA